MNMKEKKRLEIRTAVENSIIVDEDNRRIQFAAMHPLKDVLKSLNTTFRGLDEETVIENRARYGNNKVTHEKKKSLLKRMTGAFINPFTAILFCLSI